MVGLRVSIYFWNPFLANEKWSYWDRGVLYFGEVKVKKSETILNIDNISQRKISIKQLSIILLKIGALITYLFIF